MPDVIPDVGAFIDATADTLDVVTLAEAKAGLNRPTSETDFDAEIAAYITAISRLLDDLCGPIVRRTVTDERHSGGTQLLFLRQTPVYTITSVTEYSNTTAQALTAETFTANTAYDYLFDTNLGTLTRRSSTTDTPFAATAVKVTYVAGRYADTATVDRRFKLAAVICLSNIWKHEQGGGSVDRGAFEGDIGGLPGYLLPNAAMELIRGDMRGPSVA